MSAAFAVLVVLASLVVLGAFVMVYAALAAASRFDDINDAPCLVCRQYQCVCGEQ